MLRRVAVVVALALLGLLGVTGMANAGSDLYPPVTPTQTAVAPPVGPTATVAPPATADGGLPNTGVDGTAIALSVVGGVVAILFGTGLVWLARTRRRKSF